MEIGERVARLETEMTAALAGVANFRSFQEEARDFFSRHDEREKSHIRRQNAIIGILSLIAAAILATCAVLALHPNATRSALQNLSTSQYQYTLAERTTK